MFDIDVDLPEIGGRLRQSERPRSMGDQIDTPQGESVLWEPLCVYLRVGQHKTRPLMRITTFLMILCGRLVSSIAFSADGGEKVSSHAGTADSRVFNVLRYGAVGDDKTDNTEAFSACLKAVVEAGGGRMYLPDGVYRGRIIDPGGFEADSELDHRGDCGRKRTDTCFWDDRIIPFAE